MRIRLITITHKSPAWIKEGYEEYAKRLPPSCTLELIEIPAEKRMPSADTKRLTEREGEKMLAAIKPNHRVIALDVKGQAWSTEQLAARLASWLQEGRNVDLLVGGPEGLAPVCLQKQKRNGPYHHSPSHTYWLSSLLLSKFIEPIVFCKGIRIIVNFTPDYEFQSQRETCLPFHVFHDNAFLPPLLFSLPLAQVN